MRKLLFPVFFSLFSLSCGVGDFPSQEFSPPLSAPSSIVRGSFKLQSTTCQMDGIDLVVTQDLNRVFFKGGLDYGQEPMTADVDYSGYIDSDNVVHFDVEGASETLDCLATLIEPIFQGTCDLSSGGSCDFVFSRSEEEDL